MQVLMVARKLANDATPQQPVPWLTSLVGLGIHPSYSDIRTLELKSERRLSISKEEYAPRLSVTVSHDMMADIITRPYPILCPAKAGITGLAACRLKSPPLPASVSPGSPRPGQGCSHRFSLSKTADQEHVYFILCSVFHGITLQGDCTELHKCSTFG
ncbi:hypothetical protein BDW60DRAFT_73902 [Aspergillus nidulans var. acristatus]